MSQEMTWICEACKSQNYIQNSKCKVCGQEIPKSIYQKIYEEELALQKTFLKNERINRKTELIANRDVFWRKYNDFYKKCSPKAISGAYFLKKSRKVLITAFVVLFCLQIAFLKLNNLSIKAIVPTTVISRINDAKKEFRKIDFSDEIGVIKSRKMDFRDEIGVIKSRKIEDKYHEILQIVYKRQSEINEKIERIFNNGN